MKIEQPRVYDAIGHDLEEIRAGLSQEQNAALDAFLSTRSVFSSPTQLHPDGYEKHMMYVADFHQFCREHGIEVTHG